MQTARAALPPETLVCSDVGALLAIQPDYVIEAAGQSVVADHGGEILRVGCSLYVLSVGSLAHETLRTSLLTAAEEGKSRVLIPAGALAGFDGLLALRRGDLHSVKYTSAKPGKAWEGTIASAEYELHRLRERTVIFSR